MSSVDGVGTNPPLLAVSATPTGIATALTHLSARMRTTDAARSHPDTRPHPPLVTVSDEQQVPPSLRENRLDTGVELRLPPEREYLFVAAPLAYYLGATVTLAEEGSAPPRLLTSEGVRDLAPLPEFQTDVADLLRHVFFLDCLVREHRGEEFTCHRDALPDHGLCPIALADAPIPARLEAYLDVPIGAFDDDWPEWHLATYADPTTASLPCLPYLLDSLSLVYLPEWSDIDAQGLLRRSLDDFFRAPRSGPVASVDVVDPELQEGELHAWLAEGVPVSAFTPSLAAFENRLAAPPPNGELDVCVVLNDDAMDGEHEVVARTYRERSAGMPADVTVHESLSVEELARLLESEHDFVHYIGHCEVGGLQCADGGLDCESLSGSGVRTFFLNACGSYHQGRALVERGSVAGAVTLRTVLNRPAATVGTTFARLLMCGFGIERAMQLARRQIMMSTDYAVVGDGTYSITGAEPAVVHLDETEDGYELTYRVPADGRVGDGFRAPFESCRRLRGTAARASFDPASAEAFIKARNVPVIYDGTLYWSDTFSDDLKKA
ncbi:hypothetical protein ACFQPA_02415 [Halomarina halobia]|uniref:CHAT domain-containing protein n=1 Tax=Halomarina halobia TaxID=3033386 RepID=A0ABD6A4Y1_9EURY|nr:hypothetical protein [Halomarina sp. PSR21]